MTIVATDRERATLRHVDQLATAAARVAAAGATTDTLDLEAIVRDLVVPLMLLQTAFPADPVWERAGEPAFAAMH